MRDNPMRARWESSEAAIGAWLSVPSQFTAEIVARCDFDYVCIDAQHGAIDYNDTWPLLQAINLGQATPVVRVPWNEPGIIGKCLDAGARAAVIPMVNTREQAEAAVRSCRYAPAGSRSYGPSRQLLQEGPDYFEHANADVAVVVMIETLEAVGNLDEILSVPGVDAVYIGPSDLSITLGLPPGNNDGAVAFDEAYASIVAGCRRHGVVPGCHASAGLCERRLEQGFGMITVTADAAALSRALAEDLAVARSAGSDPAATSTPPGAPVQGTITVY